MIKLKNKNKNTWKKTMTPIFFECTVDETIKG